MDITVTDIAKTEITRLMEDQEQVITGVRIAAEATSPLQASYRLAFVAEGQETDKDTIIEYEGFKVYIDENSLPFAQDITLDYVDGLMGRGFKIDNPHKVPPHLKGSIAEKIQTVIDEKINPSIASHGGQIALIDVKDSTAYLQFGGGCQGCGMIDVTLKQGVEVMIKEAVPEIEAVRDITDHAEGTNPYYQTTQ
ncbi:MAG: NifU family protein [Candidatus Latescibacteria bacterium]|jgi:Fe/S biogenesis protein NfuA|nr:NifU family protein [Candidatus Latescibacterota bacterium]